ncbi:metallophosphoesterase [bacterium SCSIO 12741]|nr:metallophosphoesterase [bacterium SCSIO 12741]
MKPCLYSTVTLLILACLACKKDAEEVPVATPTTNQSVLGNQAPDTLFTFAFVGCNRVSDGDHSNHSTANVNVLRRIFNDISEESTQPKTFFFLGDIVRSLSRNPSTMDNQLSAWVGMYNDPNYSKITNSGIEMVVVPGNHEMLYYKDRGDPDQDEWPWYGASKIWLKHMSRFMPSDRDTIADTSIVQKMTFSLIRNRVGFIIMNTDTYNSHGSHGEEGRTNTDWVAAKIKEYQSSSEVDHVFVLGHKPYYVDDQFKTGHKGFADGPVLWPEMQSGHVVAFLAAHKHDYQRWQPESSGGTYQIVAGHGGSSGAAEFFGYTLIYILSDNTVHLVTKGVKKGSPFTEDMSAHENKVRDEAVLTWEKNKNTYPN